MNIKKVDSNVYRQYVNSSAPYGSFAQKLFGSNGKISAKQDSLSFSSEAALLRSSSKNIKEYAAGITSRASDERINELRRRIQNGDYTVDPEKVADSILDRYV